MELVPLDVRMIAQATQHLELQPEFTYVPATDSTNRVARDLPPGTWRHGSVVLADYQEAGKGRKGRDWQAPARSSLLLSVILVPPSEVTPGDIVMAAALAVADTARVMTGLVAELKWPNDVLLNGKKVSGILVEVAEEAGRRRFVVGIGLNVNFDPSAAGIGGATGLSAEVGHPVSREKTAIALLTALDVRQRQLVEEPDAVFREWEACMVTIGRQVSVLETDDTWVGFALGVERDGGLRVRTEEGRQRVVYAADVSVRPQ